MASRVKKVGRQEVAIFGQLQISERKDYGCSKVPICSNISAKMEDYLIYLCQKQPKTSQSCTKVALHCKNCAVAQKRESCAKVALGNITIFWGNYVMEKALQKVTENWTKLNNNLRNRKTDISLSTNQTSGIFRNLKKGARGGCIFQAYIFKSVQNLAHLDSTKYSKNISVTC